MAQNGVVPAAGMWEIYLTDLETEPDSSKWQTKIGVLADRLTDSTGESAPSWSRSCHRFDSVIRCPSRSWSAVLLDGERDLV